MALSTFDSTDDLISHVFGNLNTEIVPDETVKSFGSKKFSIRIHENDGQQRNIFVKSVCVTESVAKQLLVDQKEFAMYSKVIPEIKQFCASQDKLLSQDLTNIFPKYYGGGIVDDTLYFFLESLTHVKDEENFSVMFTHSEEQIKETLKSIALYHSVFYSINEAGYMDFRKEFPFLGKNCLVEEPDVAAAFYNGEFIKSHLVLKLLLKTCKDSASNFNNIALHSSEVPKLITLLDRLSSLMSSPLILMKSISDSAASDSNILIHGDFHPSNVAVSKSGIKIFDFQLVHYSDIILDILPYLGQACSPAERMKNLETYLNVYFQSLSDYAKRLGCKMLPYSGDFDTFRKSYQMFLPFQLLFGFSFTLWKGVDNYQMYHDLTLLLSEASTCNSDEESESVSKILTCIEGLGPRIWNTVNNMIDCLKEMEQNDVLVKLEKFKLSPNDDEEYVRDTLQKNSKYWGK